MELLNKILQAVLEIALPVLFSSAAVWMIGKVRELMVRLKAENPDTYEIVMRLVNRAVYAAEQIFQGSGRGAEKKAYVLSLMEKWLAEKGIHLDLKIIEAYIEAEVHEMNNHHTLLFEEIAEAEK